MPRETLEIVTCDRCGRSPHESERTEWGSMLSRGWFQLTMDDRVEEAWDAFICPDCIPEVKAALRVKS